MNKTLYLLEMKKNENKALYEAIMLDVAKVVKKHLVEASSSDKQIVVFTGKSKYFKGDAAEKFIEKNTDYKTSHVVNDKTYLIITGEKPGPNKIAKAKELQIPIMPEDKFYRQEGLVAELPEPLD